MTGALLVLWLNMVLQPCAMAAESEHDCPHCPPAHHEQMAAHHGHGHAKKAAPCAALEAQCGDFGDISVESRGVTQADDLEQPDVLVVEGLPEQQSVVPRITSMATGPPSFQAAAPPIYVLNCAYLK